MQDIVLQQHLHKHTIHSFYNLLMGNQNMYDICFTNTFTETQYSFCLQSDDENSKYVVFYCFTKIFTKTHCLFLLQSNDRISNMQVLFFPTAFTRTKCAFFLQYADRKSKHVRLICFPTTLTQNTAHSFCSLMIESQNIQDTCFTKTFTKTN